MSVIAKAVILHGTTVIGILKSELVTPWYEESASAFATLVVDQLVALIVD